MSTFTTRSIVAEMLQENCEPAPEDSYKTFAVFTFIDVENELCYEEIHDFYSALNFIASPLVKNRRLVWEIDRGLTPYGKKIFPEVTNIPVMTNINHSAIRVKDSTIYLGKNLKFTHPNIDIFKKLSHLYVLFPFDKKMATKYCGVRTKFQQQYRINTNVAVQEELQFRKCSGTRRITISRM